MRAAGHLARMGRLLGRPAYKRRKYYVQGRILEDLYLIYLAKYKAQWLPNFDTAVKLRVTQKARGLLYTSATIIFGESTLLHGITLMLSRDTIQACWTKIAR
jgi:hypothetical protein